MLEVDWIEIPGGTVLRGTPTEAIDAVVERHAAYGLPRSFFAKEAPRAEISVSRFAISRTPVTLSQWAHYCSVIGSPSPGGDPRLPIDAVTWDEATGFCSWASDVLRVPVALPEEVQWERAARGDDAREYPWGDRFEARFANLAELGLGHALPVGSLPEGASPFGVLDMAGNVDEWTASAYAPYPGAPDEVPEVEDWANDPHITRGGSFHHCMDLARCARRHGLYGPAQGAGFRLALREVE